MNSTAEDIKDMLESDSELTFELHVGKEPATPIETISIFETMGGLPQLTLNKTEKYEYCGVQIRVRAYTYVTGYDEITRIKDLLHGRAGEIWNGTYYSVIYCSGGPFLLDYDKNQNVRFIINFRVQRR